MKKNNLDERQEQALLQIEHRGCWLAFWGLLAAMVVQLVAYGADAGRVAGEWIIFMILALYLAVDCMRNGIWDRRLKPNWKANLLISVIGALVAGLVVFLSVLGKNPEFPEGSAAAGGITAAVTFPLCFAALTAATALYRRRVKKLEDDPEES